MIQLSFHGASETVTGSKYLLDADGTKVLFDCGLFQGLKELRLRNWAALPFSPGSVQSVVLTHAHLDHVGYLPRFVNDGFSGPVYATKATADIAELMLLDTAKIQEEDASYANRKGFSKHKPALPLYNIADAKRALKKLRGVHREEWFHSAGPIWCRYHDAGHLLGSSMIEVEVRSANPPLRILFSGDVGRYNAPLYFDPSEPPQCDYLICESTYGDHDHPAVDAMQQLTDTVHDAIRRGGVMIIPSFAVGRSQQLIYLLQILIHTGKIPKLPIFLDSPMAVSGMNLFHYYAAENDLSEGLAAASDYQFDLENVRLCKTPDQSKQINSIAGSAIIIASSGMLTGGRVLHHLKHRLNNPRNTVVLAGYMAEGTRGRLLKDGAKTLRLLGADVPVRAAIVEISTLSGHAGHAELLRWLAPLAAPRQVFITHGEKPVSVAFADELRRARLEYDRAQTGAGFRIDGKLLTVIAANSAPRSN